MNIDFDICFILSAGMGSRMGKIGEFLPKPLWPFYGQTLIDYQISYAKSMGAKKIYVNLFHQADLLEKYLKNRYLDQIDIILEKELLDVGGAIQNLKRYEPYAKVLILNSDQFLFYNQSFFLEDGHCANLLCVKAGQDEKYNKVLISEGRALGIEKYRDDLRDYFTYSGLSLVDLRFISAGDRPKKFFYETLDFDQNIIDATILDKYLYYDFGTKERYVKSLMKIDLDYKQKTKDPLFSFFKDQNFQELNEYKNQWGDSLKKILGLDFSIKLKKEGALLQLGMIEDLVKY